MAQLIDEALASGGITGPSAEGFANALKQKFDAVQHDMAVPNYVAAFGDLKSFIKRRPIPMLHAEPWQGDHERPGDDAPARRPARVPQRALPCPQRWANQPHERHDRLRVLQQSRNQPGRNRPPTLLMQFDGIEERVVDDSGAYRRLPGGCRWCDKCQSGLRSATLVTWLGRQDGASSGHQ
jgi:hypothetical protein